MSGPVQQATIQQSGSPDQKENTQAPNTAATGTQTNPANPGAATAAKKFDAEKFATAARREKAALDLQNKAKTEFEKSQAAIAEAKAYQAEKLEFRKNPLEFIKKHYGMTYEDLTELQLNDGKPSDATALRLEMEQWKAEQLSKEEQQKKAEEERISRQQEEEQTRQINDFKKGIPEKLKSIEKLDMVNLLEPEEQSEEIFKIIESHWADEEEKQAKDANYQPTLLSVEEAAEVLEDILYEQFVTKAGRTKKFGDMIKNANKPNPQPAKKESVESGFRETRTLTNDTGVGSSPSMLPPATEDDRMKRALSALNRG